MSVSFDELAGRAVDSHITAYYRRLHRALDQQSCDMNPAINRLAGRADVRCPADQDLQEIYRSTRARMREQLWSKILENCLHTTINAVDHIKAGALLLSQPESGVPVYAHASVARVVLESATRVLHVLDPTEVFEVRFARGVAALVDNADSERKTANDIPANAGMSAPGPRFEENFTRLVTYVERANIEIVRRANGGVKQVRVTPGSLPVSVGVNVSEEVRRKFPALPGAYRLTSGVSHASPFVLDDSARIEQRIATWEAEPLSVGSSVLIMLHSALAILTAFAWHRAHDNDASIAGCEARIRDVDEAMRRTVPSPGIPLRARFVDGT